MNYDVDYFIKKFEAIPEELWWTGDYYNPDETKFCAFGHCGYRGENQMHTKSTEEGNALFSVFKVLPLTFVHEVNDGDCSRYQQPTPKQRILAALRDIKAKTQPLEETPKPQAERVVYKTVVIDSAVVELQKTTRDN